MRSVFTHKFWVILLSVLALGALTELAIGMRNMSFREKQVFEWSEAASARVNPADLVQGVISVPLKTQLTVWGLVVLMFLLVAMLLSPEGRKRLLLLLFRVVLTYWALYLLFTRYPDVLARISLAFSPAASAPAEVVESVPPPVFTPPPASSWMTYLASLGVMALTVFLAWRFHRLWRELNPPTSSRLPVRQLARIARASLHDLSSGRDSTDVILNCYFRMSDVVGAKKNLSRSASMTPQEFASRLEEAGLPSDAVQRLTRLFEAVRYGQRRSDPKMVKEAVACLTTILQYCGEPV
jgi:hypothetical protein